MTEGEAEPDQPRDSLLHGAPLHSGLSLSSPGFGPAGICAIACFRKRRHHLVSRVVGQEPVAGERLLEVPAVAQGAEVVEIDRAGDAA